MSEPVLQRHKIRKTRQALASAGFRPDEIGAALCQGLGTLLLAAQENAQATYTHVATAIRSSAAALAARRLASGGTFSDIPDESAIADQSLQEAFEFVEALMKQLMTETDENGMVDLCTIAEATVEEIFALDLCWTDAGEICDIALSSMMMDEELIDETEDEVEPTTPWYN